MIALDKAYERHLDDDGVQLMLRLQEGDESALGRIMQQYAPYVATIVSDLTGTHRFTDDLVQEVFLRVFNARHRYMPSAKLKTWLAQISRNLVFNLERDMRRRRTLSINLLDAPLAEGECRLANRECSEPVAHSLAEEQARIVHQAVKGLLPRQRRAVELVYFCGMGYAEAAVDMQTTPTAVKALLVRARFRLREVLNSATSAESARPRLPSQPAHVGPRGDSQFR